MHVNDTLDLPNLQAIIARFHTMYDRAGPNDCWLWKRAQSHNGYGIFQAVSRKTVRAHRMAYVIAEGPIPRKKALFAGDTAYNLQIRHRCHNPLCVNPRHLVPGTAKQNHQDKVDANRFHGAGEDNYAAKLTRQQVEAIRLDPRRQIDIAADYGVARGQISSILRGKSWRCVKTKTLTRPKHKSGASGARNGRAKLTEDQVRAIRTDTRTEKVVASEYSVSTNTVGQIRRREIWKTVRDL